ncbi:nucleotide binding protein [Reticulomyxa filosa]|uniref:Nucleotide binding protein n=1 Tax=Reticulomyxa filosa TaxID=46433 RepID=X6LY15_RETFI|nr:nucleotide binding protein [Reticulomyxa filosa]|eukprot:ETO06813.1 nucleotide binding protein [Reticulomyxa filosa]
MGIQVLCGVKFSSYHYYHYRQNVICSSSADETIRFWYFKDNQQLQILKGHDYPVYGISLSPFNYGRYLYIETSKLLHVFNEHKGKVWFVEFSPLQRNNNNEDKNNNIDAVGGNGYTICTGSGDTTKQMTTFKGYGYYVAV